MRILITGVTGFVGEYLAKEILENNPNYQIFGIDKIQKPFSVFPKLNKKIKIYEGDITNKVAIKEIITTINPDQIYHLAGYSSSHVKDKDLVYKINVLGTINILKALTYLKKRPKILLISSSHVYGVTRKPAKETATTKPVGIYGQSKLEMENESRKFAKYLDIIIVRPSNHTGAGQRPGFLVPDLVNRIIDSNRSISITNPQTKKDISDVRDVVSAYQLVMKKGIVGEIYNIGRGEIESIQAITKNLIKISDKKIVVEYSKSIEKLPINSVNILKIKKLGWKPKYTFMQTLKSVFDFYKKGRNI